MDNTFGTLLYDGPDLIRRASNFYDNGIVPAAMEVSEELPRPKINSRLGKYLAPDDSQEYPELFLALVARDAYFFENKRYDELSFIKFNERSNVIKAYLPGQFREKIFNPHCELLLGVHEHFGRRKALMYRIVHERMMRSLVQKNQKLMKVTQNAKNIWPLLLVDNEQFEAKVHRVIEKIYRALVTHRGLSAEKASDWLAVYDAYTLERTIEGL